MAREPQWLLMRTVDSVIAVGAAMGCRRLGRRAACCLHMSRQSFSAAAPPYNPAHALSSQPCQRVSHGRALTVLRICFSPWSHGPNGDEQPEVALRRTVSLLLRGHTY